MSKRVVIFMGSASDEELVKPCTEVLGQLQISYFITVTSAHRTPERTEELVRELEERGAQVFICAAGMDALLATVQMPPGFPVATVALDKAGARNAAWLAAQILALADKALAERLAAARKKMQEAVADAAQKLEAAYSS